jgi:hypothetical protein
MPDNSNTPTERANQTSIITHAVLVGLTPLIPVPFIDDLVKGYFQRRLVRVLAAAHNLQLKPEEIAALAEDTGGGCLRGCLIQTLIFPLKMILRKIFFFLEWKRAVDLTSHTYHQGYLVDYALREGWMGASSGTPQRSAAEIHAAIEEVCRAAPIKPVETAIGASFRQSKSMLRSGARILGRAFRRVTGKADDARLAAAVASVEEEETREIGGVVRQLQKAIEAVPDEHFRNLRKQLTARLKL